MKLCYWTVLAEEAAPETLSNEIPLRNDIGSEDFRCDFFDCDLVPLFSGSIYNVGATTG